MTGIMMGAAGAAAASGAGAAVPEFSGDPYTELDFQIFPNDARAGIEVDADGAIETYIQAGNQGDAGRWDGNNSLNKADYQFRMDTVSGSTTGGDATDTWLAASGGLNSWEVFEGGLGVESFSGTLRVRLAVSPFTEYDSASVTLNATSEP